MTQAKEDVPILRSAYALRDQYDAWLCDVWGVIHNGRDVHGEAVEACAEFRKSGGTVVFITNAPRPAPPIMQHLDGLGVDRESYDVVITSGDVTRRLIKAWSGRPIFHLGPERDLPIFTGLGVHFADEAAAEVIVNTGLFDDTTETPDDYRELFARFLERSLPMICANPDIMVERGADLCYCAGALAELYREMGGSVDYAGKPHPTIYEVCRDKIAEVRGCDVPRSRILAIGDGLKTDMTGAAGAGLDALFVPSGIHVEGGRELDQGLIDELFNGHPFRPVAAIAGLTW